MRKYVSTDSGKHTVDFTGYDYATGKFLVCVDGCRFHELKGYYRPERTLDDHMGNTDCGWYVNVPINGKTRRVYTR